MFRSLFLTFMAILLNLPVEASIKIASHEDYVHFSEKEKDTYIIQLMEHVVALEDRYKRDTELYGYSQERFEKFQKIISKLQSELLIGKAYAAPKAVSKTEPVSPFQTWDQLSQKFTQYSTRSTNNGEGNCIFAGWISKTRRNSDGNVYCTHPGFMADKPGTKTAQCGSNDKNTKRNWIQCNPAVFGYKKESDKSLFCVETRNKAQNSSFECMKEALKESAPNSDSREKRLAFLKNKFSDSKNFQNIFMFNYKTCVCSVGPEHFNKDYQNYMRPGNVEKDSDRYRTCYGMMRMMTDIQNQCRPPEFDQSIFNQFESFVSSKEATPSGLDGDSWYKDFITKELKTNKQSVAAYNQLCPSESIKYDGPSDNKPGNKYTCTATCTTPNNCSYEVMEEGKPETKKTVKDDNAKLFDPNQEMVEIKPEIAPEGLICPITWTRETSDGSDGISVTGIVSGADGGVPGGIAGGTDGGTVGGITDGADDGKDKEPEIVPETETIEKTDTDGERPTITITVKSKEKTQYKLVAETQKDEGWTFTWTIKDAGELKVETNWEVKETPKIGKKEGLSEDGPADSDETDKNETPSTPSASKEISQKRYKTPYKICGQLKKEGKETVEECQEIDKLGDESSAAKPVAAPSNFNQGFQQTPAAQPVIRRSSDTSAIGIK